MLYPITKINISNLIKIDAWPWSLTLPSIDAPIIETSIWILFMYNRYIHVWLYWKLMDIDQNLLKFSLKSIIEFLASSPYSIFYFIFIDGNFPGLHHFSIFGSFPRVIRSMVAIILTMILLLLLCNNMTFTKPDILIRVGLLQILAPSIFFLIRRFRKGSWWKGKLDLFLSRMKAIFRILFNDGWVISTEFHLFVQTEGILTIFQRIFDLSFWKLLRK